MLYLILFTIIPLLLITMLLSLNTLISKKTHIDKEKSSIFECGFKMITSPRQPFSMHFYLILIIFLIFDVEFMLILPMIYTLMFSPPLMWWAMLSNFIIILLMGLYMEWYQHALNWY